MKVTRLYYDSEFTGLRQNTTLISLALVSDQGETFYAEFSDYETAQVDDWIHKNVIQNCQWLDGQSKPFAHTKNGSVEIFGTRSDITRALKNWLTRFEKIEIWADCPAWDWVLFCELFGGAQSLPSQIHYMPGDLATLLRAKKIDPDIPREQLAKLDSDNTNKHNALWDAQLLQRCVEKLL